MNFSYYLEKKNMTQYQLSKISGVPYSTIHDIYSGKAKVSNCRGETIYRIGKVLGVSIDDLIENDIRCSFEDFKSFECHKLKSLGDINYICNTLESNKIRMYYNQQWYPECLYCLAMLDYISKENKLPTCSEYNDIRKYKLNDILWPEDIILQCIVFKNDKFKKDALKECLPDFLQYNIVERDVRDVC